MTCDIMYFDQWVGRNYEAIRNMIAANTVIDEDAFQDAYLDVRKYLARNRSTAFAELFLKSYKHSAKHYVDLGFQYFNPNPLFFDFLHEELEDCDDSAGANKRLPTGVQIDKFCKRVLSDTDYMIYRLKWYEHMPDTVLAEVLGVSRKTVAVRIGAIKETIKRQFV